MLTTQRETHRLIHEHGTSLIILRLLEHILVSNISEPKSGVTQDIRSLRKGLLVGLEVGVAVFIEVANNNRIRLSAL
jgi:hypothetical protein